jgi:anti-anti-sigma factor
LIKIDKWFIKTRLNLENSKQLLIHSSKGSGNGNYSERGKWDCLHCDKGTTGCRLFSGSWKVVKEALKGQTTRLLFDLSALEYLSSAGLRVLLTAAKEMRRKDGKLVLCSLNEFVKEIFEVSGFQSLIPIVDSVESGIEVLS